MNRELDISGRVKILEHGQEKLEAQVDHGFAAMGKSLSALNDKLTEFAQQAHPVPFKEVITTAVATAALVAYLLTALNSWFDQKAAPLTIAITRFAEQDKNGELAVLKYRVQQLEGPKVLSKPGT